MRKKQIGLIYEAHKLGMSLKRAAKYAGVNHNTVSRYWKKEGLKPNFVQMSLRVSEEAQNRVYEAHELGMSRNKAAKYAGVSNSTVSMYWRQRGLTPNFKPYNLISEEMQKKIYEAHELRMYRNKAAKYAGVSESTVSKYWKKEGLMSNYQKIKVTLTHLLDAVFNTVQKPDELLTIEDIMSRLDPNKRGLNEESLNKNLKEVVRLGFYEVVEIDGKIYYRAGMPSAMDGMIKG